MRTRVLLFSLVFSACAPRNDSPNIIEVYLGGADISSIDEDPAPLPDTTDSLGPYIITAVAKEGRPLESVDLIQCGSAQDCIFQAQRDCTDQVEGTCQGMNELSDGIFRGEIPGREPNSTIFFVLRATAQGGFIDYFPEIRNGEGVPASFRVLSGDAPPPPPPPPPTECNGNDDCGLGEICNNNQCRDAHDFTTNECQGDFDCIDGFNCSFGFCEPEACLSDAHCPVGSHCALGECLSDDFGARACDSDADCGDDGFSTCLGGLCVLSQCFGNFDCPQETPNCVSGTCLPFVAEACDSAQDCSNGFDCVASFCFPAGLIPTCDGGEGCEEGRACIAEVCVTAECKEDSECGPGQACVFGGCASETIPAPSSCASNEECPSEETCFLSTCYPSAAPLPVLCGPNGECEHGICTLGICI